MQIILIGLNHRTAPVALRERAAFSAEAAQRATGELRQAGGLEEAVILSTCNRSELYGVRHDPAGDPAALELFFADFHGLSRPQLDGCLYVRTDRDAVGHLFRVAAGLDSQLLGEAEVLGQVREAYRRAADAGSTGPVLNRLFQAAIEAGRRVRAETDLGTRPMSAASAGIKLAERVFGDLSRHSALLLGAGEVAEQAAEQLRQRKIKQLWVAARNRDRAAAVAAQYEGATMPWEELPRALLHPDVVVASVAAEQPVLSHAMLAEAMHARDNRSLLLLDLGLPRNIDPAAAALYNLYLYDLDSLSEIVAENRRAREREIPRAEAVVAGQVSKFEAWRAGRAAGDVLDDLRARLDARRRRLLEAQAGALAKFGPEERAEVERLTERFLEELIEEPADRLRSARTWRERVQMAETLRNLFGLDSESEER